MFKREQIFVLTLLGLLILTPFTVQAAATLNPFSPDFKLSVCDGPAGAPNVKTPCDFSAVIAQINMLINAMIVIGVLFTVVSFSYAGWLYITGVPGNISRANEIFKKVGIGFIIMLAAWFIVYQILDWFVVSNGAKALLGNP